MSIRPNHSSFVESLSLELSARSNRVRYLIGDSHWASDGYHNEHVVRDFLEKYTPRSVAVSHGFIRALLLGRAPQISPEIDILLTDADRHVPVYSEGGLTIVQPEAVRAYFEVKSTFERTVFRKALAHIKKVQGTLLDDDQRRSVWRCAFFNSPGKVRDPRAVIFEEIEKAGADRGPKDLYLPNCIVLNGVSITFINPGAGSVLLRYFETEDFSLACSLADLLGNLLDGSSATYDTDFQRIIEQLDVPAPTKHSF